MLIDDQQSITAFGGFPDPDGDNSRPPLMFTGIQIMEPAILDFIPRGRPSESVRDVYPQLIAMNNHSLGAYVGEGEWHELSTLDRYLATSLEFLARRGDSWIAGSGCQIDRGGRVERSVLWNRVEVGEGAVLRECLVADDVRIPDRCGLSPSGYHSVSNGKTESAPGQGAAGRDPWREPCRNILIMVPSESEVDSDISRTLDRHRLTWRALAD